MALSPPDPDDFELDLQAYFTQCKEQQQPPQGLLRRLQDIPEEEAQGYFGRLWWAPVPIAALSLLLILWFKPASTQPPLLLAKGTSWQILIARPQPGTPKGMLAQELTPRSQLNPGDLVQFVYKVPVVTYVIIAGLNQQGQVYSMVAQKDGKSLRLKKGKGVLPQQDGLAQAFKLDGYIGVERFFIATSKHSFSYPSLKRAIRERWLQEPDLRKLNTVPGPWHIASILFVKVPKK